MIDQGPPSCHTAGHKPQDAALRDRGGWFEPLKPCLARRGPRMVGLQEPASGESRLKLLAGYGMSGVIRVVALAVIIRPHTCEFLVFRGSDPTRNLEYHRPLGGGVEFGESASQAIRREVLEEIGIEVVPVRLLTAIESLFVAGGQPKHEIGLLVELPVLEPGAVRNRGISRSRREWRRWGVAQSRDAGHSVPRRDAPSAARQRSHPVGHGSGLPTRIVGPPSRRSRQDHLRQTGF